MSKRKNGIPYRQSWHHDDDVQQLSVQFITMYVTECLIEFLIACGNKVLICGGDDENQDDLDTTEWFDGAISKGPTMLNAHYKPACAFIDGM